MSTQTDTAPKDTTEGGVEKPENPPTTTCVDTNTTITIVASNKPMKKVKSKKDLKDPTDPTRFESPGVSFNAKLIGIDDVESARGDKMCQEAMHRLKIAVKTSGQHKQKIIINVSLDGIRIIDVRTQATNHTHAVHRISFISRDTTDARAFGYIYGAGEGKHKFYAIKTEKAAEALVLTLRDLFQAVYQMKKKEVEEAKHKKEEEPAEKAQEADEEPVYSVPIKLVENGTDPTYQVPSNNGPVKVETQTDDLLNLENELQTLGKGIEQIDTMEELFRELEAPPTASQAPTTTSSSSWADDFASLSQPGPQTQPMFSLGGAPFSTAAQFSTGQPFQTQTNPQATFANQPFGMPAQSAPFGFQQQQPVGGQMGGPFGPQPNLFGAPPGVPPRTGMGFAGQPGMFPGQQAAFPGTPFPGVQPQAPGFPGAPAPQPSVQVTLANDPFGSDPFSADTAFEESILTPARPESPSVEQPANTGEVDIFGDLVAIGDKGKQNKSPKEMFSALSMPPKKSLNELKVVNAPSPKPASPIGFQASGDMGMSSPDSFNTQPAQPSDPFGSNNNPFGSEDPFGSDPFASNASTTQPAASAQNTHTAPPDLSHDALFGGNIFGGDDFDLPIPSGPPPPLPKGPPPPLPKDFSNINVESQLGPLPPPRPSVDTPPNTQPHHTPPLPPRPKSTNSESNKSRSESISSLNSFSESQVADQQQTPPLPPRPNASACGPISVPRPRPRASVPQIAPNINFTQSGDAFAPKKLNVQTENNVLNNSDRVELAKSDSGDKNTENNNHVQQSLQSPGLNHSAKKEKLNIKESQKQSCSKVLKDREHTSTTSVDSKTSLRTMSSKSSVTDPFVSTDPFASEDPFTQIDPFANDPFAPDPFSDPAHTNHHQPAGSSDPFTSVLASPKPSSEDSDPFSVFDKTFSSDSFKFDRSSSKKTKLKVSGQ